MAVDSTRKPTQPTQWAHNWESSSGPLHEWIFILGERWTCRTSLECCALEQSLDMEAMLHLVGGRNVATHERPVATHERPIRRQDAQGKV